MNSREEDRIGTFAGTTGRADVAALIVTYQSVDEIDELLRSLRRETAAQVIRVVVADNSSTDGTIEAVLAHRDVILVRTGGNLGYAAGVNAAARAAGDADCLLVLNPDIEIRPGSVRQLRECMERTGAGIVVPRIIDAHGAVYPSLRREPNLLRALGDAVFGGRFPGRRSFLSEIVGPTSDYERPHSIDWATGAALLISARTARKVGDWDERFFLYSEETDYFRRARARGEQAWYEPAAVVRHTQGGSGSSPDLDRLMAVNRIRYARKHFGRTRAGVFHGIVALHELARAADPSHRDVCRTVLHEEDWALLPRAHRTAGRSDIENLSGAIIIPAHNEAAVIARTLKGLGPLLTHQALDVIVAANGCTDETASIARSFPGVHVVDLAEPSKTNAMNAAERLTNRWPRLYLDADIIVSPATVCASLTALSDDGALAGRPPYAWDLEDASTLVRAYYRARGRIPSVRGALWGAGVFGLSEVGRRRFGEFPEVTADDLFVDRQFSAQEKRIVDADPVRVVVPHTARSLLKVLRRQARGARGLDSHSSGGTLRGLLENSHGPRGWSDAACYGMFALLSRWSRSSSQGWERDLSSRQRDEPDDDTGGSSTSQPPDPAPRTGGRIRNEGPADEQSTKRAAAGVQHVILWLQAHGTGVPLPLRHLARRLLDRTGGRQDAPILEQWDAPLVPGRPAGKCPPDSSPEPLTTRDHHVSAHLASTADHGRCLIVTNVLDSGGVDEFVALLARRLPEVGWTTTVAKIGTLEGDLAEALRREGIDLYEVTTTESFESVLLSSAPDVMSVHGPPNWVLEAAHRRSIPVVETLHGAPTPLGTDWRAEPARSALITSLVAVSQRTREDYLRGNPRYPSTAVKTVPVGHDIAVRPIADRDSARAWLGLENEFLFCSLGRVSAEKNSYGLVNAFVSVAQDQRDCHLLLAGRIDDAHYARQVLRLVAAQPAHVRSRIHLRGNTNCVPQVLAASDCLVMDSFYEGWGMASVEALIAGIPLIRSDTGGALEQVGARGERGVLVRNPAGDPDSVTWRVISRLRFADQVNREELVRAMRSIADDRISWAARRVSLSAQARTLFPLDEFLSGYDQVFTHAIRCPAARDFGDRTMVAHGM